MAKTLPPPSEAPPPPPSARPPPPSASPPQLGTTSSNNSSSSNDTTTVIEGETRKLCCGTRFGNTWKKRYVRVTEPSRGLLRLEYAPKLEHFEHENLSKIKQVTLAHPGFIEFTENTSKHHANLKEGDDHCLEFHVHDGHERKGHGRALVFRFDSDEVMQQWEAAIVGRFTQASGVARHESGGVEVDHNNGYEDDDEYDQEVRRLFFLRFEYMNNILTVESINLTYVTLFQWTLSFFFFLFSFFFFFLFFFTKSTKSTKPTGIGGGGGQ